MCKKNNNEYLYIELRCNCNKYNKTSKKIATRSKSCVQIIALEKPLSSYY